MDLIGSLLKDNKKDISAEELYEQLVYLVLSRKNTDNTIKKCGELLRFVFRSICYKLDINHENEDNELIFIESLFESSFSEFLERLSRIESNKIEID